MTERDARPPFAAQRVIGGMVRVAASVLVLYAVIVAALWWGQERLLFHPQVLPPEYRFDLDSDVHERVIEVPGARLSALHLQLPAPRGIVFFLHGNGGCLADWFVNLELYRRANFDLFMIDYRGYGKSSGRIEGEAQLRSDVRAAWQTVAPLYAGGQRVIFGRSLGTGLAAQLAAEQQPDLTILVSPYSSLPALAAEHYPWAPSAVLRYRLDTAAAIGRVQRAVLLVHGGRDTLIPPSHSEALRQLQPRAQLRIIDGAGHNDLQAFDAYRAVLREALASL